jgi:post-segregation antitoxin (ccd killing protein)
MNTASRYTRVNLTIPTDILAYLKRHSDNMSRYISEAVRERMAREQREKALAEILSATPTFTDVADGASFVQEVRSEDTQRDDRLGLV